ncbi:hypothetical protein Tco_0319932 [Tanacetum coccineum]
MDKAKFSQYLTRVMCACYVVWICHKKDKNETKRTKSSTGMERALKSRPKAYASLMGQPIPILLGQDRFKDLLRKCPHHGFSELHQIDTFYNALTQSDQDSLNAAADGNLLNRTPRDALMIIENKSKVRTSRNKPVVSKMSANTSSTTACPSEIADLTDSVNAMIHHVKTSPPEPVKAITESCVTCGGPHPYYECLVADGNTFNASAAATTYNQNQGYRPQGETNYRASNQIGPPGFPPVQNNQNRFNQNQGYNQNRGNNFNQGNQNYQAPPQVGPSNELSNSMKT